MVMVWGSERKRGRGKKIATWQCRFSKLRYVKIIMVEFTLNFSLYLLLTERWSETSLETFALLFLMLLPASKQ
jgi:hypothetical protein